ncbi:MAG: cysteine--tRNA ligase [Candidatus Westeberhardia cardiocondylae]|nr:cysteine--tRNA ligase [Candidatus Westeberhardia cardiocondylae]
MLKIFNTLTKKKENFNSILPGRISIYVCGVTVYDLCHIGHARTFVIFDIVIRYFFYKGYQVNYIRNITDISENILYFCYQSGEDINDFICNMICEMHRDLDRLNILRPNKEPRTTEYIQEIIKFIQNLLINKFAYISYNGDIMFSVDSIKNYGILSKRSCFNLSSYHDVHNSRNYKRNLADFVLWKVMKSDCFVWKSPWGYGRPGWHIECSAINTNQLGYHFDIHGGGADLIFPHHENEIAQSVALYGMPYVNIWMHVGLVNLKNRKISKSSGNYFTLRKVFHDYDCEVVRYFLMSFHYRKPIEYTKNNFKDAYMSLRRLYISLLGMDKKIIPEKNSEDYLDKFCIAMDDDFNTPKAFSILFDISHEINKLKIVNFNKAQKLAARLRQLAKVLGLLQRDPGSFLKNQTKDNIDENIKVENLIRKRNIARSSCNWVVADNIRNKLFNMGIILEDTAQGTIWRR